MNMDTRLGHTIIVITIAQVQSIRILVDKKRPGGETPGLYKIKNKRGCFSLFLFSVTI